MRKVNNGWIPKRLDLKKRTIVKLNEASASQIRGGYDTIIPSRQLDKQTKCTGQVITHSSKDCLQQSSAWCIEQTYYNG